MEHIIMSSNREVQIARVVDVAQGEVSRSSAEHPRGSNITKYGKWYGMNGVAWCAIGVTWVMAKAGLDVGIYGPRTAWVPDYRVWGRARGRWSSGKSDVRVGDIMTFRGGKHVEIVVRTSGKRFWCVGFNTSWRGAGGSFADGVYVAENERTYDTVDGTLHPFYGVTEGMVKLAQEAAGVTVDGDLGPKTLAAVKKLQKKLGLAADGIPGADTYQVLKGGVAVSKPAPTKPAAPKPATKPAVTKNGTLVTDGRMGTASSKALQRFLNDRISTRKLKIDGLLGPDTYRSLQEYLGHPVVDGLLEHQSYEPTELGNGIGPHGWVYEGRGAKGSKTVRRLQKWIGVGQDGVWYEGTTKALQHKLNAHGVGMG